MHLSGWGNYPVTDARIIQAVSPGAVSSLLSQHQFRGIARGLGKCYGDSSLASSVIKTRSLDHFLSFDEATGVLHCEGGVSLAEILDVFVPRGWFLPVTPGTKFVSVAGAIASDVHGKNHHLHGSFGDHLLSFQLLLASGEVVTCSVNENTELFHATCGGMGLTGIILQATLSLNKINGSMIDQQTINAENLEQLFDLFDEYHACTYSVAWIDCLSSGKNFGRALLYLGEHNQERGFEVFNKKKLNVPVMFPNFVLNRFTSQMFSNVYYARGKTKVARQTVHYDPYFYPLDSIHNWNRIYGKRGFVQYQFVVPKDGGREAINTILGRITQSGRGSFLSVLKAFGKANQNLLSFPTEGYTLALDMKVDDGLFAFLEQLDEIVLAHNGRLYLAKDARMSEATFKQSYSNWEKFVEIRQKYGADKVFNSLQSQRLGI